MTWAGEDFLVLAAAMIGWTLLSIAVVLFPQVCRAALRLWWAARVVYYRRARLFEPDEHERFDEGRG